MLCVKRSCTFLAIRWSTLIFAEAVLKPFWPLNDNISHVEMPMSIIAFRIKAEKSFKSDSKQGKQLLATAASHRKRHRKVCDYLMPTLAPRHNKRTVWLFSRVSGHLLFVTCSSSDKRYLLAGISLNVMRLVRGQRRKLPASRSGWHLLQRVHYNSNELHSSDSALLGMAKPTHILLQSGWASSQLHCWIGYINYGWICKLFAFPLSGSIAMRAGSSLANAIGRRKVCLLAQPTSLGNLKFPGFQTGLHTKS